MRRDLVAGPARSHPTPGTARWSTLERQGRLLALITQNVDGLHQAAGSTPDRVLEIHGTVHEVAPDPLRLDDDAQRPGPGRGGGA